MSTEKAVTTAALKAALQTGAANGRSVETLAYLADTTPRAVRKMVDALIDEGVPICAHPATGYYIAESWAEVEATYTWLRSRGLHSLVKASKLRAAFAGGEIDLLTTDQPDAEGVFA